MTGRENKSSTYITTPLKLWPKRLGGIIKMTDAVEKRDRKIEINEVHVFMSRQSA